MKKLQFLEKQVEVIQPVFDALIVGTGAAGYNGAVHLHSKGVQNFAILTENRLGGTSRNTGSDKQTYYKVACAGEDRDAPRLMAETLFSGGSMDGDIALCEASHSLEEFFHLVSLGVGFPHNRYGEFAGYKTDHDPLQRASSTGPYTSKDMTERLEAEVNRRDIRIIDKTQAVKLLVDHEQKRVYGILCLDENNRFTVYCARNIIFAVGGPAGLYQETVYPLGHFGASGVLAQAGAEFANITEWQYGIGSIGFRWNLSGSYQQVIPRYVGINADGIEEEFLGGYFSSIDKLIAAVFLKGYQWPFSPEHIQDEGSSLIDWAVYTEKHLKGKRIYLDFMHNPQGKNPAEPFNISNIDPRAYAYLANSNALGPTPIERLLQLNPGAYQLYKSHGIDLAKEYVEIDILPQHHNGGVGVNLWWETSIKHLFAIGECAGTHGVKRPGGSALNSGQVGGLRAASYIADYYLKEDTYFDNLEKVLADAQKCITTFSKDFGKASQDTEPLAAAELLHRIQKLNSETITFLRTKEQVQKGCAELARLGALPLRRGNSDFRDIFKAKEILLLSRLMYEGISYYIQHGGKSRGSYLILDTFDIPKEGVEIDVRFRDKILLSRYDPSNGSIDTAVREVRPIPLSDTWFERVWRDYREGKILL
ncbi:MAG: FAD-binding protein [Treponema sp.]|jgi:succinate dehydrogenase/fumarate reductase flavoprotein subunit|nr:FAD-binding protein [Treponema sp.]